MKQRWIFDRVNETQRTEAIEFLAEELEHHVTESFDSLPELVITSPDICYTRSIDMQPERVMIEMAPLPFDGDAKLFGEHTLSGRLYGFHQDTVNGGLRVYVSIGDAPRQLTGGIYTPLLSVDLATSDIKLAEVSFNERLHDIKGYVLEQSESYSEETKMLINVLCNVIEQQVGGPALTLQAASPLMVAIAKKQETTPQVIDALLEMTTVCLKLDQAHTLEASSYREVLTDNTVKSYKPQTGPIQFERIVTKPVLIGDTASRGIGLFLVQDATGYEIPVQYITKMFAN